MSEITVPQSLVTVEVDSYRCGPQGRSNKDFEEQGNRHEYRYVRYFETTKYAYHTCAYLRHLGLYIKSY